MTSITGFPPGVSIAGALQFIPPRRMASIGVIVEAFQAGIQPGEDRDRHRAGQAGRDEPGPEFERRSRPGSGSR